MGDLAFEPATVLLARLQAGLTSSRELVEHYLERVARMNPRLNAVVALDADGARGAADEADRARAAGEPLGSLHGFPMTVKDTYLTAGLPTTYGTRRNWPEEDVLPVTRLRAAGAIIFGKTNTPPFARDIQTYNRRFGTTRNPWDPARTSGGSSGGAAAAVAAGLTGMELGGDIGGSIRIPSAYCGVYGHKSSWGLVAQPPHPSERRGFRGRMDIAVTGPIARSADDLELGLDAVAGPGPLDGPAVRLQLPPPRARSIADYRVGLWLDDPTCRTEPEVLERLQDMAGSLKAAGAQVSEARPDIDLARAVRTYHGLLYSALSNGLPTKYLPLALAPLALVDAGAHLALMASPLLLARGQIARAVKGGLASHRHWIRLDEARDELRHAWARYFEQHDVLLCPASPVVAPKHNHRWGSLIVLRTIEGGRWRRRYIDQMMWAGLTGVAYLPSTVAPAGCTPGELPVGVQIVGPYMEDRTTIDVARHLASITGGYVPPPGFE